MSSVEIVSRIEARRKWSAAEKAALLAEVEAEGGRVTLVARRHRISESLLYNWRAARKAAVAAANGIEPPEFLQLGVVGQAGANRAAISTIVSIRRRPQGWRLRLDGMEDSVGFEGIDGLDKGQAAIEAEPLPGVAMPLDVEVVAGDPVEAGEGGIELLAEIFRKAGAVALDEAVFCAMPLAADIDWIVELCPADHRQEARLQELCDQSLARYSNGGFFRLWKSGHLLCCLGLAHRELPPVPW